VRLALIRVAVVKLFPFVTKPHVADEVAPRMLILCRVCYSVVCLLLFPLLAEAQERERKQARALRIADGTIRVDGRLEFRPERARRG
jgi:hypothetical protein